MIGYGAANLGAGALQGFTVTGSLSKSAAAEEAGGRSPVLLVVTAGAVVLTILVPAGLFANLPEAALAAIVIHAVSGMIDFGKLARLWRIHRDEYMLAAGALLDVVVAGILAGIVIGVALSFVLLIHRLDHPHVAILGRNPEGTAYEDLTVHPEAVPVPGVLVHRFGAPLILANAEIYADLVLEAVAAADPPPRAVVLDLISAPDVDSKGDAELAELLGTLESRGIELAVARATGSLRERLRADEVVSVVGPERIFPTVRDAVAALGELRPSVPDGRPSDSLPAWSK
jgi:SulP family sulfate permease